MRQILTGMIAAAAVMTAGAATANACGFGGCSPCAAAYVAPCAPAYVPSYGYGYGYTGCGTCGGWAYERLAAPITQYYYVNQGPTYTGPGAFAPYPAYEEDAYPVYGYGYRWHHRYHHSYAPRHYGYHYGPYYHGRRVLRRYY
ncbi:hypothetical protein [Bradyrhizobium sp. ARR65]|uniref:hypothetical protein n=1 Tax=Bradyrhizobium sp. ARR65 TaxID=1040989 RepID=UPI000464F65B|nr:hypothetical protein [Bradyrhizobium sp. ARR65]